MNILQYIANENPFMLRRIRSKKKKEKKKKMQRKKYAKELMNNRVQFIYYTYLNYTLEHTNQQHFM